MLNSFCVAPWVSVSVDVNGSLRPCCQYKQPEEQTTHKLPFLKDGDINELWNGDEFKKLRKAFINGEYPTECEWCWRNESKGVSSYRLDHYHSFDFGEVDYTTEVALPPQYYDLKLSNVCNMKCRICGAQASSLFLKEMEKVGNIFWKNGDPEYWLSDKLFNTTHEKSFREWLPSIKYIELTGGEPVLSSENRKLIDVLIENDLAKNIKILMTTNGKIYDDEFIKLLSNFSFVTISLSIDDIKERLNYQRYPCNWKKMDNNIKKYNQLNKMENFKVTVNVTVSNLNVFYLEELVEYLKSVYFTVPNFNILHDREYHSIRNLHIDIKNILAEKYLDNVKLIPVLKFMVGSGDDFTRKFLEDMENFDKIRNQSFKNVFPEWYKLLNEFA